MSNLYSRFILRLFATLILLITMHSVLYSSELPVTREGPELEKIIQDWLIEPKIPEGWEEIDRKQAKISSKGNYDVFVLMTDGVNDQIVWFEKMGKYWKMSVVESLPTKSHLDYGVDIRKARLIIKGKRIYYGLDATEPISIFDWDVKEKIFIRYVRP